jgi:hypothetical protein
LQKYVESDSSHTVESEGMDDAETTENNGNALIDPEMYEVGKCSKEVDKIEILEVELEKANDFDDKANYSDLQLNDFIIVELKSAKGRSQRFIGKIIQENPCRCSYVKASLKISNAYVFPPIPGEEHITEEEFVTRLPTPTILRRGALKFNESIIQGFF